MDKLKLIKTIVFTLTFLLVFGSLMLMGTLYSKTRSSAKLPEQINLEEPAGSRIRKFDISGSLLYIKVSDGGLSDRIIIYDTDKGRRLTTIHLN